MVPLNPYFKFPAYGTISCGKRTDLVKKLRRHAWRDAGLDIRHDPDSGEMRPRRVKICIACGRDEDISASKEFK
jgi:hypothetical protein